MGKRASGGAGIQQRLSSSLDHRVQAALQQVPTGRIDDLAEVLRLSFPEYKRQKSGPFKQLVGRTLSSLRAAGTVPQPQAV